MFETLSTIDLVIIAAYFAVVFLLAGWVTIQERRSKAQDYGSQDYFLGGKNLGWFVIGASLFASNIGSEHLVGLAGSGARGDMPAAQFELLASLILMLLGWVFVPFYIKSGVFTMPEFLERRYSSGARTYLSVISIVAYVMTKISITIFAGALVFEVMGVPFWTGAMIVVIATGIYTIFGGLRAVVYTDMMQMFVLVGGAIAATFYGLEALGGWGGMMSVFHEADQSLGYISESRFFNLWRPMDDPDFPWTGILFGAPILGVWYWCTDQFIVQRVLSAKDVSNARKGTLFGGFLKILPLFIFVIPGVIAFALSQKGMLSLDGDPDKALPAMITDFLPPGLKGLILAGLLAALMSSLSSVFNSCSTLFTIDFYKKWRANSSERELVFVGQAATVVLVAISLGWIPFMRTMMEGSSFYQYLQSIQAYISPPIAAAFLLGLFIKRINAKGALWSLWTGFFLGIARLILEFQKNIGNVVEDSFLYAYADMNFLHFAILLFVICSAVLILMSLLAPQDSPEKLKDVTYEKPEDRAAGFSPGNKDFWLTLLLIAAILTIWIVFSPLGLGG
ncbi:MAG: sodium/solute symporter [Lewinellaceae bacterium]|nr:sodium:solute symporter [Phaeodactylibacter sp.]MCB9041093.1 sodium/solute symporter [Lewinellaceae bacterium]